jgi:hypothetical protein
MSGMLEDGRFGNSTNVEGSRIRSYSRCPSHHTTCTRLVLQNDAKVNTTTTATTTTTLVVVMLVMTTAAINYIFSLDAAFGRSSPIT